MITVVLVALTALNAVFAAWTTALDARARRRSPARSAPPPAGQRGLAAAQVMPAVPGALLGIPLGILLFKAVGGHQTASPSALWVIAAVLGTLLAVAGLTAVPALIGARIPAAQILQSETA